MNAEVFFLEIDVESLIGRERGRWQCVCVLVWHSVKPKITQTKQQINTCVRALTLCCVRELAVKIGYEAVEVALVYRGVSSGVGGPFRLLSSQTKLW